MQLYAIVTINDKEYRVVPGQKAKIDRLLLEPGETVEFDHICRLVKGDQVVDGQPTVAGARVRARVMKHGHEQGVIVFKMNRRQLYRKRHEREWQFTVLKIEEIVFGDHVFDKRDLDPRKIRKAQAAARASEVAARRVARAQRSAASVTPEMPPPKVSPEASPEPPSAPSVVSKATSSPDPAQSPAVGRTAQGARKWAVAAALLALAAVALLVWNRLPTTIEAAGHGDRTSTPQQMRLLKTHPAQHLNAPAQPPH